MRESSIYAGWHMAGSPRRKRRRPPHPVPHFRTRPQSCDPDVITSQTILPLFVFPARPAPMPIQSPAKSGPISPRGIRHGFKHRCAYVLSTGASWRCAWICHRRHCLRVTRSQIAGRSLAEIVSPIYYHPPISLLLPSSPTSFIPTRTMFVIKATLKDETRRLTFDTSHFPRYYEVQQKVSLT